ncbi:hypothetical protein F5888DRAFT_324198 [Russula emetica]|nr:hypothetical protein F5888DRAFT_324198 [Russula emetica]
MIMSPNMEPFACSLVTARLFLFKSTRSEQRIPKRVTEVVAETNQIDEGAPLTATRCGFPTAQAGARIDEKDEERTLQCQWPLLYVLAIDHHRPPTPRLTTRTIAPTIRHTTRACTAMYHNPAFRPQYNVAYHHNPQSSASTEQTCTHHSDGCPPPHRHQSPPDPITVHRATEHEDQHVPSLCTNNKVPPTTSTPELNLFHPFVPMQELSYAEAE